MLTGIVYVPCAVTITGSRQQLTTTLVAEGPITLAGSSLTISPATVGRTALVSAASGNDAIRITGADVRIQGTTQALNGQVSLTGA